MRATCLLALLWPLLSFCQLDDNIQIVLEPGGHRANVKALMFSPDGSKLYSVSDDKTVRVWDLKYDELVNTFRGYSERGNVGMLNAGAITPDGEFIAISGYLGRKQNNTGEIRYLSTVTGDVIFVFRGHKSTVVSLGIAADQSLLASGSTDGSIGLWSLKNGSGMKLTGHKEAVYATEFSPDGKYLLSVSYDSVAILWNIETTMKSGTPSVVELRDHRAEIRSAAFSPTGEYFVTVGYDNRILLYDGTGTFIKEIDYLENENNYIGIGDLHSVSFTQDGKAIVVGASQLDNINAISYSIPEGNKLIEFRGHDNTVMAVSCFGDSLVATAGGTTRDIYIWNVYTGEIQNHFAGNGERNWKVATSSDGKIAWSTKRKDVPRINDFGELNKVFDLNTLELSSVDSDLDLDAFSSEMPSSDFFDLSYVNQYELALTDAGFTDNRIKMDPSAQGAINCYSFTPNGDIVVGTNFGLNLFDIDGKILRSYRGHHGDVFSVAFTSDQKYMVSASSDQTLCFWDLSDTGSFAMTYEEWEIDLRLTYGDSAIDNLILKRGELFMQELYEDNFEKVVYPSATLFVSNDGEWILWNSDLYYAASRLGSQRVGFQQSYHTDTLAVFYTFEQFDVQLNRPDKVLEELGYGSEIFINSLNTAHQKRLVNLGVEESKFSTVESAPRIIVNTKNQTVNSSYFGLNHIMIDNEYGIDAEFVSINGVQIYGRKGNKMGSQLATSIVMNITHVTLTPGLNKIQIWCTNTEGIQSNRETRYIFFDTVEVKPDLYILGIGASEYKDDDYNLSYAAKDIRDFVKFYSGSSEYNNIIIDTLINSEVTNDNITSSLENLNKARVYDHVIVYVAGHGVLDDDLNYFLATHDMDFNNPAIKGLNYSFLEEKIGTLNSRVRTVFIDACHSGEIEKEEMVYNTSENQVVSHGVRGVLVESTSMRQEDVFSLMRMMFSDLRTNSGATIISSAGGAEYALEGDQWNNGVFTYAVIDGMKSGAADIDQDGEIALEELQKYVAIKVEELTNGAQKPTTRVENLQYDYVFWVY